MLSAVASIQGTALSKYAKKILLATKPAPVLESAYKGELVFVFSGYKLFECVGGLQPAS